MSRLYTSNENSTAMNCTVMERRHGPDWTTNIADHSWNSTTMKTGKRLRQVQPAHKAVSEFPCMVMTSDQLCKGRQYWMASNCNVMLPHGSALWHRL